MLCILCFFPNFFFEFEIRIFNWKRIYVCESIFCCCSLNMLLCAAIFSVLTIFSYFSPEHRVCCNVSSVLLNDFFIRKFEKIFKQNTKIFCCFSLQSRILCDLRCAQCFIYICRCVNKIAIAARKKYNTKTKKAKKIQFFFLHKKLYQWPAIH